MTIAAPNYTERIHDATTTKVSNLRSRQKKLRVGEPYTIFNLLDERKSIELLPKYVSDDPDNMPSIRLFDGDMKVVMVMLERLEQKVEGYASALSTVTRDVGALRSKGRHA